MSAIRISVIGRCEIHLGRARIKPESAVFFGLLLYLGLRPGARVTREELLELFWPDAPEQARRHSLRQLLYRIRRARVPLEIDGPEVVLEEAHVHSDLGALFAGGWADAVAAEDVPNPRALFAGYRHPLGAAFTAWIDGVREDASVEIRRACMRHIASGRREGRWPDVEIVARICTTCDPLNEMAHLALAEATAMAGAKAEALRVLDAFLWEVGENGGQLGRDARVLRDRIAAQPEFHLLRPGEPPLIGRAEEMGWLNVRRDAVAAGTSSGSLLVGPAGIGKSAIIRAFSGYSEMKGWRVVTTRLRPGDYERPMSALFELIPQLLRASGALGAAPESIARLRRLIDSNAGTTDDGPSTELVLEADIVRARVREAALDLVAAVAEETPLLLIAEDVHWIDKASLNLLSWLVDSSAQLPVMWLMTARPESRLAEVRAFLPPDRYPAWTVGPLAAAESAALFRAFSARQYGATIKDSAIHAVACGNPLYIREIARHSVETESSAGLPRSLRALMSERINRLSPQARRILYGCAVLGRFATVSRIAQLLELSSLQLLECIGELNQLGLLSVTRPPGTLGVHDLWQEHLLESMPAGACAVLHLRAGELLAAESVIDSSPAVATDAAWHFVEAGAPTRAVILLQDAATHLLRNGFTEDAVDASRRAWEYAQQLGGSGEARQLHLDSLVQAGQWQAILAVTRTSEGRINLNSADHSDEELLAIEALWRTGSDPTAVGRAIVCAESADAQCTHRLRACLLTARAAANWFDLDLMRRAQVVAKELTNQGSESAAGLTLTLVIETELGDVAAAAVLADRLIEHERRAQNIDGLARALRFASYPYRALGDVDRTLALAGESFAIAERCQLAEHGAMAADICATACRDVGDYEAAELWIERAASWRAKVSLKYMDRSHDLLKASIEVARRNFDRAAVLLGETKEDATHGITARERITALELWCRISIEARDSDRLSEHVGALGSMLERSRCFSRQDSYVRAYVDGLGALGREDDARKYREEYERAWRRDKSKLVWSRA